jgi:hypothetical protein
METAIPWVACAPSSHADFATRPICICSQHFAMVALRSLNGRAVQTVPQFIPWHRVGRRESKHRPNLHLLWAVTSERHIVQHGGAK